MIIYNLELETYEVFEGAVELDERYFGCVCKCKRGRGSLGKVAIFGILKRAAKVYVKVVPDTRSSTLMSIIT